MIEVDERLEVIRRIEAYLVQKYHIPASVLCAPSSLEWAPPLPPKPTSGLSQPHFSAPCPPLTPKSRNPSTEIGYETSPIAGPSSVTTYHSKQKVKSVGRLQSSVIDKRVLIPVDAVLAKYPALVGKEGKTGELACKLAREAFFGEEVMMKCTANGYGDRPGLPQAELLELKAVIRKHSPQYWSSPHEFEMLWCKCLEAISQGCKRLRNKTNSFY